MDSRVRDTGNDSASTAPRSTEESLSEDVFTESELSPIREELVSSDELRQDKSSGASLESVQTVHQSSMEHVTLITDSVTVIGGQTPPVEQPLEDGRKYFSDSIGSLSAETALRKIQGTVEEGPTDVETKNDTNLKINMAQESVMEIVPEGEECLHSEKEDSKREGTDKDPTQDSETDIETLRKLWKTHTMQQTKQQRDNMHQDAHKEMKHKVATADGTIEGKR